MGGFEMRRRLRRSGTGWVEGELRRQRPEPRDEFVRQLSGRISADSRRRPALGLRVAFAGSLASLIVVAFAAFGGIGYAASAANSIAQTAQKVVTPKPKAQSAAADQYVGKITICHHTHSRKNPFVTITISQSALNAHLAHGDTIGYVRSSVSTSRIRRRRSYSLPCRRRTPPCAFDVFVRASPNRLIRPRYAR